MSVRLPIFNLFSGTYDWLTGNETWQDAAGSMLRHWHEPAPPQRVLDIGCGPGASTFALAQALPDAERLVGVDLAPAMIQRARTHAAQRMPGHRGLSFEVGDATALRFDNASFDLCTGHSFLYLVEDRPAVLQELARVLRPGGLLVLLEPWRQGSLAAAVPSAARAAPSALRRRPLATTRFGLSMVAWRAASAAAGRLDEATVAPLLGAAGLQPQAFEPVLGGLGLHVVARRGGTSGPSARQR